jgi:hypothetical protein
VPNVIEQQDVVGANSAIWSAAVVPQIALAAAAGGAGRCSRRTGPAFTINATSFLSSAAQLIGLPQAATPVSAAVRRVDQILEGLRTIQRNRFLATLAAVQALVALSAGATSALLVVLTQ